MSRNKEIKFVKWFDNMLLNKEFKNEYPYNYFLNDKWFENLPENLQKSIIKLDNSDYKNEFYDIYLERLDGDIRSYIHNERNGNFDDEDIKYLLLYLEYCESKYSEVICE